MIAQEWCDGSVGVYGTAYSASTALYVTALDRPAVKACVVLGTGADLHDGWVYTNGAFELGWNVYWSYMTLSESIARLDVDTDTRAALAREYAESICKAGDVAARLPISDHPLLERCGDVQYREWLEHPDYDDYYRALAPHAPHRLVCGPWEHTNYVSPFSTSKTGEIELGPAAACGVGLSTPLVLDWFDRWLKGEDAGAAAGVRYWQLGENEWREAASWPPPHRETRWFLHSAGAANTHAGDGVLSTAPPGDEPADTYVYEPLDPAPTVLGKTLMPTIAPAGIADQTAVAGRADVLCYTAGALREPVEVHGAVRVELWASSSAVDTDFTAKLVDVAPDGYAMNLADGIVRARYRESTRRRSEPLRPGEPNPNTGSEIGSDGAGQAIAATQRVLHDAAHPSALVLPVAARDPAEIR